MKEYVREGWYTLELPDHWEVVEEEGEPTIFHDPEGAGALHATVESPRPLKPGTRIDPFLFLRAFVMQSGVSFDEKKAKRFQQAGMPGAAFDFTSRGEEGKLHERLWFFGLGDSVLFLSYTCRHEEREVEGETVDRIARSVRPVG